MASQAQRLQFKFPVLKDPDQKSPTIWCEAHAEAFVLNGAGVICYAGRIDDQYGIGFQKPKPTRKDLAVAIDEVLAGKSVSQATTEAAGCLIGRVKRAAPAT